MAAPLTDADGVVVVSESLGMATRLCEAEGCTRLDCWAYKTPSGKQVILCPDHRRFKQPWRFSA